MVESIQNCLSVILKQDRSGIYPTWFWRSKIDLWLTFFCLNSEPVWFEFVLSLPISDTIFTKYSLKISHICCQSVVILSPFRRVRLLREKDTWVFHHYQLPWQQKRSFMKKKDSSAEGWNWSFNKAEPSSKYP